MANKQTIEHLHELQALPLNLKVRMTKQRIREWVDYYGTDGVYVSFSGGKDSTVLLHIVREMYGDKIPAVFCNTGLEYPEIVEFVKTFPNVVIVKPKMTFREVTEKYGYPIFSKEVCETVYGARKYLTALAERGSPDRQTDRQTDRQAQILVRCSRCLWNPKKGTRPQTRSRGSFARRVEAWHYARADTTPDVERYVS